MTCSSDLTAIKEGDFLTTGYGTLEVLSFLGKGKSGNSWLVKSLSGKAVLKIMHDEDVSYYTFHGSKLTAELSSYKKLIAVGIRMPELFFYDDENEFLIKEYIEGKTGGKLIAAGEANDQIIAQLCSIYQKVRDAGLNIDYFPSNFVICRGDLYYIDYECNPYDYNWGLENWGIFYWINEYGMKKFLAEGDVSAINLAGTGLPVKSGLHEKADEVINKYLKPQEQH